MIKIQSKISKNLLLFSFSKIFLENKFYPKGKRMPKMKSVKSAVKRFKVGKNKIKRGSAFRSHILTKKPAKRMRDLRTAKYVHSTNVKAVEKMLGI